MMKPDTEDWGPCPSGKFSQLSQQWAGRRRRRSLIEAGAAVSVGVVLLVAVVVATQDNTYADITCTEVQELAGQYEANTLAPELLERVERHLEKCQYCQDRYREKGLIADAGSLQLAYLFAEQVEPETFAASAPFWHPECRPS